MYFFKKFFEKTLDIIPADKLYYNIDRVCLPLACYAFLSIIVISSVKAQL